MSSHGVAGYGWVNQKNGRQSMEFTTVETNEARVRSRDRSGLRARLSGRVVEDRPVEAALRQAMAEREQIQPEPAHRRRSRG
jgi:hypothetical protein